MAKMVPTGVEQTELVSTALVVDSDSDSRVSLCKLLAEAQIRTVTAANPSAALAVLRNQQIDMVVCEDLGGLCGAEFMEACEALFPRVRRVYLAKRASAELHCEIMMRGRVHATVSNSMHPVDLRNVLASLALSEPRSLRF